MSDPTQPNPSEPAGDGKPSARALRRARAREVVPAVVSRGAEAEADQPRDRELFLLRLRHREGRRLTAAGHEPLLLDGADSVWVVYSGHVEVFVVQVEAGQAVGPRRHLFRASAGDALFGMDLRGESVGLLVCGVPGTQLLRLKRAALERLADLAEFAPLIAALVDNWVVGVSASLVQALPPREFTLLAAGEPCELPADGVARTQRSVVWVRHETGSSRYLGRSELPPLDRSAVVPLAPGGWLEAIDPVRLAVAETPTTLPDGSVWPALDRFHVLALIALTADAERLERLDREQTEERTRLDQEHLDAACIRLAGVLAPHRGALVEVDSRDSLLAACQLVGNALGITIKTPRTASRTRARTDKLREITWASRVRARAVALRGTWWKGESGPLLGILWMESRAVALLPIADGGYELHDPAVQQPPQRVTETVAARLRPLGFTFYRRFDDRALSAWDLVRFGLRGRGRDLLRVLLAGAAVGALGMATPIIIGALFDLVIPGAQRSLLLQLGAGLMIAALATTLFELTRAIGVLRLSTALAATEAALMERLLDLPVAFFRSYTVGDLVLRALGLQVLRETLSGNAVAALLSSVFAVFSIALLFFYDARLAWIACALVVLLVTALGLSGYLQVRYQRIIGQLSGQVAGTTLQLVGGVAKLRVAGAEERAFAYWAGRFAEQRRLAYGARKIVNGTAVFTAAYPVLASVVLFGVIALSLDPRPPIGALLAILAAFGQFVASALALSEVLPTLLLVAPAYERARPILQAAPELDTAQVAPGELSGAIAVDRVSFRYSADGPLILDDVSLAFAPGEFVALVGPSGAGKSTLLRLLLRFESPQPGAIFYDGHDLATLDARAVRRQIGTVLQSGRLMSGDIFTNIVGASTLTLDDAWAAARMARLDEDIEAMPMGMHTIIGEGGSTLSGGQRQRLLIARAVVNRPRIIFFDEATSALDNRTQDLVSKSLADLAATRVVIAHRLSTVVNADRIYVLKDGRIAESGTYRELMQQRGVFAALARRQIV